MKEKNTGFVLLLTLCSIMVISMLLLTCMQQITLYRKAINRREMQHQRFYQLEEAMQYLMKRGVKNKACIMKGKSANWSLKILTQHQGCSLSLGAFQYRYLYESLDSYPCWVVSDSEQNFLAAFKRLTLLQEEGGVVLQVSFISKGELSTCTEKLRILKSGISSWRYFVTVA